MPIYSSGGNTMAEDRVLGTGAQHLSAVQVGRSLFAHESAFEVVAEPATDVIEVVVPDPVISEATSTEE
jgi:hypothetical protein